MPITWRRSDQQLEEQIKPQLSTRASEHQSQVLRVLAVLPKDQEPALIVLAAAEIELPEE